LSEGLRTHIALLTPSGQTGAVIHPRAFAILKAHGNASRDALQKAVGVFPSILNDQDEYPLARPRELEWLASRGLCIPQPRSVVYDSREIAWKRNAPNNLENYS